MNGETDACHLAGFIKPANDKVNLCVAQPVTLNRGTIKRGVKKLSNADVGVIFFD